jgi:hypothetical protein
MNPLLTPTIIASIVAGLISIIGIIMTNYLVGRREEKTRRREEEMQHLRNQIEEFYGPLLGYIQFSEFIYEAVVRIKLPTKKTGGRIDMANFSEEDQDIWNYLAETYFLPNNSQIATLLRTKIYLLESPDMPDSFKQFLKHSAQFEVFYSLWKHKGIDSSSITSEYPAQFDQDVEDILTRLRNRYNQLRKT